MTDTQQDFIYVRERRLPYETFDATAHTANATGAVQENRSLLVDAMDADTGTVLRSMKADGGAAANDALLQFQADILDVEVERPVVVETTALGAAYLAGLAVGFWDGLDEIRSKWALDRRFRPGMAPDRRAKLYGGCQRAVERSRAWAEPD